MGGLAWSYTTGMGGRLASSYTARIGGGLPSSYTRGIRGATVYSKYCQWLVHRDRGMLASSYSLGIGGRYCWRLLTCAGGWLVA